MDVRIFDPSTFTIPHGDGQRFGPLAADGKGIMRTSVDPENFTTGLKTENGRFKQFVDIVDNGQPCPYRAEFTDWDWMLNKPIGTYELITYEQMITTPINNQSPVSIFQSYVKDKKEPDNNGSVIWQLELSGYKQMTGAEVGQLQIINHVAKNADGKYLRKVTPFIPQQNVPFLVTFEALHESKENGGFLKITINEDVLHESNENMIFEHFQVCGQPKFGIYHHYLRTNYEEWAAKNIAAGHNKFYMETGPVTIIRFDPGEARPTYHYSLAKPVRPSLAAKPPEENNDGSYDEGFIAGVKQEVDALNQYAASR